jgi:hypothetical protein
MDVPAPAATWTWKLRGTWLAEEIFTEGQVTVPPLSAPESLAEAAT